MKIKGVILVIFAALSQLAIAQQADISGFVRTYEGVNVESGDFSIIQQTLNLNFEKRGEKVAFKANPMMYLYNSDDLHKSIKLAIEKGLIIDWFLFNLTSIRIAPPLIITHQQIKDACNILISCLNEL